MQSDTRLIDIVAGARPNFMKIAALIKALDTARDNRRNLDYRFVHTGQHYDKNMSGNFLEQLGIPTPTVNFGVGSGTQAEQTSAIMIAYEKLLEVKKPGVCLVVGDVNSTLACAIAAQKGHVPVAHVEAGIRSGDWRMPEEINRLVTDAITNWFFTTSRHANKNLLNAGVPEDRIFFVGNTMIDTLFAQLDRISAPSYFSEKGLSRGAYLLMTLHRPSNVDYGKKLAEILTAVVEGAGGVPVVFPMHPRTRSVFEMLGGSYNNLIIVEPQAYHQFIFLMSNAKGVITDSGGITEETTVLGVPCATLRATTERPETIEIGTNELVGERPDDIRDAVRRMACGKWKKGGVPELWDGRAAERIVQHLDHLLYRVRS
ncbi:UDP-N-acetylglucosamine 2-epimerase (non-hydrolyzing) [bacterium]|nr:UDP-N-acetylglucosamine 2-epimerase (non-hydrolyzing) [bacterium]